MPATPDDVSLGILPNPGGPHDPLGESVLVPGTPWCRVFEPTAVRLVIGRFQNPERELDLAAARQDGVPIHRRATGGGAVVLAPGCLVVALRLRVVAPGNAPVLNLINPVLIEAIASLAPITPSVRGLGDLTVTIDGGERKILGASLRRRQTGAVYLAVLLVGDQRALMERYLRPPSRQPDYRDGRAHRDFCTHLSRWGVPLQDLRSRIGNYCCRHLERHADQ